MWRTPPSDSRLTYPSDRPEVTLFWNYQHPVHSSRQYRVCPNLNTKPRPPASRNSRLRFPTLQKVQCTNNKCKPLTLQTPTCTRTQTGIRICILFDAVWDRQLCPCVLHLSYPLYRYSHKSCRCRRYTPCIQMCPEFMRSPEPSRYLEGVRAESSRYIKYLSMMVSSMRICCDQLLRYFSNPVLKSTSKRIGRYVLGAGWKMR